MMSLARKGKQQQDATSGNKTHVSFCRSQLILFESRKKWGILYSLATVTGLFFMPSALGVIWPGFDILAIFQKAIPLPLVSFLVTVGMFVLNDLVDADLDRANGKKRPIPSGMVSKKQAWTFILLTNGTAFLLSVITFNPISILIVTTMLIIGIMYSAPKIALMKRFVIKTCTIAIYYALCALLGITSIYGFDIVMDYPIVLTHGLAMLAIMIFISSTLNDLGDVDGDKAAGRRTVPIVIGKDNTIKMSMILALCMPPLAWMLYGLGLAVDYHGSIVTAALTSLFALVVASKMAKMRAGLHDMESMRNHHKKLFPLNLVLQSSLVAGGLIML